MGLPAPQTVDTLCKIAELRQSIFSHTNIYNKYIQEQRHRSGDRKSDGKAHLNKGDLLVIVGNVKGTPTHLVRIRLSRFKVAYPVLMALQL